VLQHKLSLFSALSIILGFFKHSISVTDLFLKGPNQLVWEIPQTSQCANWYLMDSAYQQVTGQFGL